MRKIALVTTSRADYGIQSRLIHMLQERADVDFSLIVSGTHLSIKHGMTVKEIEKDGIKITHKLDIGIDEESDISRIMARAILEFSSVLSSLSYVQQWRWSDILRRRAPVADSAAASCIASASGKE